MNKSVFKIFRFFILAIGLLNTTSVRTHEEHDHFSFFKDDDKQLVKEAVQGLQKIDLNDELYCDGFLQDYSSYNYIKVDPSTDKDAKKYCSKPYDVVCKDPQKKGADNFSNLNRFKAISMEKVFMKIQQEYGLEDLEGLYEIDGYKKWNKDEIDVLKKFRSGNSLSIKDTKVLFKMRKKKYLSVEDKFTIDSIIKGDNRNINNRVRMLYYPNRIDPLVITEVMDRYSKLYKGVTLDYYEKIKEKFLKSPQFTQMTSSVSQSAVDFAKTASQKDNPVDSTVQLKIRTSHLVFDYNTDQMQEQLDSKLQALKAKEESGSRVDGIAHLLTSVSLDPKKRLENDSSFSSEMVAESMVGICGTDMMGLNAFNFNERKRGKKFWTHILHLCPGLVISHLDPAMLENPSEEDIRKFSEKIMMVYAHELGHSFYKDYLESGNLDKFKKCLEEHHADELEFKMKFRKLRHFNPFNLAETKIDNHANEIFADHFAINSMVDYLKSLNPSKTRGETIDYIKNNYSILCNTVDDGYHPSGEWRINNLLRGHKGLSEIIGCSDSLGRNKKMSCDLNGETGYMY